MRSFGSTVKLPKDLYTGIRVGYGRNVVKSLNNKLL